MHVHSLVAETVTVTTPEPVSASALAPLAAPPPAKCDFDIVCVGAGYSGLYLLHKAHTEGFSIKAIEAGAEVGGTWCEFSGCSELFVRSTSVGHGVRG